MQKQLFQFCTTRYHKFLPLLKTTTKSAHFLPAKKKIPPLRIELQTKKNLKDLKTLYLNT